MLHSLENITGASVIATDGVIGTVRNFLLDDQSWMIRYVVVDVKSWLNRHGVLLSVAALRQPDWSKKTFHVDLTKEQVRHSPDVDTQKPVSRQQEIAMKEYFGWPSYWGDLEFGVLSSTPTGEEFPVPGSEDPHLRSAVDVEGYEVRAHDGEIGRLEDFIMDDDSWHVGYVVVKTGDWLHRRSLLVSTRWVESISWGDRRVKLNQARGGV